MGSLMSGWDSHGQDPKSVAYKRNRSLTRGEINAYWSSKKKLEEDGAISSPSKSMIQGSTSNGSGKKFERSNSAPLENAKEGFVNMENEANMEKLIKKNGWWTRSNWAFLNEPF